MGGCLRCALVRASGTNRSARPGGGVCPRSRTLTATSRLSAGCRPRNTGAKPASPIRSPALNSLPRAFWRRRRSVAISSDVAEAKRRNGRRVALGAAELVGVWLFGVWPPPLWWRDHWPRETALMRAAPRGRSDTAGAAVVHATPLAALAPLLPRMVVIGEDSRFRTHHGIDPTEIADAIGADRHPGVRATLVAACRPRPHPRAPTPHPPPPPPNTYLPP